MIVDKPQGAEPSALWRQNFEALTKKGDVAADLGVEKPPKPQRVQRGTKTNGTLRKFHSQRLEAN